MTDTKTLRERVVSGAYTLDRFMEGRVDGVQFVTYTTDDLVDLIHQRERAAKWEVLERVSDWWENDVEELTQIDWNEEIPMRKFISTELAKLGEE